MLFNYHFGGDFFVLKRFLFVKISPSPHITIDKDLAVLAKVKKVVFSVLKCFCCISQLFCFSFNLFYFYVISSIKMMASFTTICYFLSFNIFKY